MEEGQDDFGEGVLEGSLESNVFFSRRPAIKIFRPPRVI